MKIRFVGTRLFKVSAMLLVPGNSTFVPALSLLASCDALNVLRQEFLTMNEWHGAFRPAVLWFAFWGVGCGSRTMH